MNDWIKLASDHRKWGDHVEITLGLAPAMYKHYAKRKDTNQTCMPQPQDHYMEALQQTRENQWKYHWFDIGQLPPPHQVKTGWRPSCDDDGCGYWNRCYHCNAFNITLLVDKAEFLVRKQLENEYP
jgi:hypothetical protein